MEGGTVNINVLYKNEHMLDIIENLTNVIGLVEEVMFYHPEIDETLVFSTVTEAYTTNNVYSPLILSFQDSVFQIPLQVEVYFNDQWVALVICIPMSFIQMSDEAEQFILHICQKQFEQKPFIYAYGLHEHEIDVENIVEINKLKPSFLVKANDDELVVQLGNTLLDGMTNRTCGSS